MTRLTNLHDRFEAQYIPEPNSGCWLWTGFLDRFGYGYFRIGDIKDRPHRYAFRFYCGPIPENRQVCHRCDIASCVNPDHLFLGTALENNRDKVKKSRQARGETIGIAKLTEGEIKEIRGDFRSQRAIAADYGISHTNVGYIKRHETWRHL